MNKEKRIISDFHSRFIGDDGAVLGTLVYSKDLFVQNSHFRLGWLSFYDIGKKAIAVNISDAVVMNARPKYALLGLMLPSSLRIGDISELNRGIKDECDKFGVEIIGGDTIKADILGISVTIISKILPNTKVITRKEPKNGYLLGFTGRLGESQKGLKTLINGGKLGRNARFRNIILRDEFFYKSAKFIHSAMDISDGLSSDLEKFLGKKAVKFSQKLSRAQMQSGEEYEILFSCSPQNRLKIENIAKKTRTKVTFFGAVIKGKNKFHGKFSHF